MPCCGGGCPCLLEAGVSVTITGSGSASDPYVISAALNLDPTDNTTFDVQITGTGTPEDPYALSVLYAETAQLTDMPDVDDGQTDGQVLAWNNGAEKWQPVDPVTAPVGAVQHDNSLDGDGSSGDPLVVVADSSRGMTTNTSGIAIRDMYINQFIRAFANAGARTAAAPVEIANTFSCLDGSVGWIDYYTGSTHKSISSVGVDVQDVMLELSGPYTDGMKIYRIHKKIDTDVNVDGEFTVLGTSELAGYSGVIVARFGATNQHPPFYPVVWDNVDHITCTGYLLGDDNTTLANGTNILGWVEAWLY